MTDARYVGRFAPSPTGDLHFGSLVAAVGSFLQARSQGGRWLVRMEDVDRPREVPGSAERILGELRRLGMTWDGEVLRQSRRTAAYDDAVTHLLDAGDAFWCRCTRRQLPADGVYRGTCRQAGLDARTGRSVRLRVPDREVAFDDAVLGRVAQHLAREVGDFVIRRADRLAAYQLAVVVDDAHQGVTEVVRGADLADSTPRQLWLQARLGLPHPRYLHLPLALGPDGAKLSKRDAADPVARRGAAGAVRDALRFLGQDPPRLENLGDLWAWAVAHWRPERIPRASAPPPADG